MVVGFHTRPHGGSANIHRTRNAYPLNVDLHRHRPVQKRDRDDQPVAVSYELHNALNATQWPLLDTHALAGLRNRRRFSGKAGFHNPLNGFDLVRRDRRRTRTVAYDANHTRSRDDSFYDLGVDSTEHVAGKERSVHYLDSVGPTARFAITRQEDLIASHAEMAGADLFASAPHLHCKPISQGCDVATEGFHKDNNRHESNTLPPRKSQSGIPVQVLEVPGIRYFILRAFIVKKKGERGELMIDE